MPCLLLEEIRNKIKQNASLICYFLKYVSENLMIFCLAELWEIRVFGKTVNHNKI